MRRLWPFAVYLAQRIGASFWFLPGLLLLGAALLSEAMLAVDRNAGDGWLGDLPWLYAIGAEGARLMLSTIAGSMITVASLVFSLTLIALTLASQQLGPRVINYYMQDRINQLVLGIFLATFVFALLVLRGIGAGDAAAVPGLSMTVALLLAIVCFLLLVYFIHQTALFIQADFMLAHIAASLSQTIGVMFRERTADVAMTGGDDDDGPPDDFDDDAAPVGSVRSGYVQLVSRDTLRDLAEDAGVTIRLECHAGHFIVAPLPVAWVRPAGLLDDALTGRIRDAIVLGPARTATQDIEFTLRAIVDIVLRALSPSLNDAHTAMAGIDRLGEALAAILRRDVPTRCCRTKDGKRVAVYLYPTTIERLFDAALQQVIESARGQTGVAIHLLVMLTSLARIAVTEGQRAPVRTYGDVVARLLADSAVDPYERAAVATRLAAFRGALDTA